MDQFKGNEPQPERPFGFETDRPVIDHGKPGVHVPPEQMIGHHVAEGFDPVEPPIGTVVQFTDQEGRDYAAIRTGDGWYVAGYRGTFTWAQVLDGIKGPVFVMAPRVVLHP